MDNSIGTLSKQWLLNTYNTSEKHRDSVAPSHQPARRRSISKMTQVGDMHVSLDSAGIPDPGKSQQPSIVFVAKSETRLAQTCDVLEESIQNRTSEAPLRAHKGEEQGHQQLESSAEDVDLTVARSTSGSKMPPEVDRPYTDGDPRVTITSDGVKQSLAMLLTADIVSDINQLIYTQRNFARKERKASDAELEIWCQEGRIDALTHTELPHAENQETRDKIQLQIEEAQSELKRVENRRQKLKEEVESARFFFDGCVGYVQETLERVLGGAGLLDAEDEDSESTACAEEDDKQSSTAVNDIENIEPSAEELLKRVSASELEEARQAMNEAQWRFDCRYVEYKKQLAESRKQAAGDNIDSQSNFDQQQLQHQRVLTRNLINAEETFKAALRNALAVGRPQRPRSEFETIFYKDPSLVNQEIEEPSEGDIIDRRRIETWRSSLEDDKDQNTWRRGPVEYGDWNPAPVEIGDSISVADFQGYGARIEHWREHGEKLREAQTLSLQKDEAWGSELIAIKRRRSI